MASDASFEALTTVTASTKRPPALDADGKRGEPVTEVASLSVLPLQPMSPELRERLAGLGVDTRLSLLVTQTDGANDVQTGDELVVSGTTYPIRYVEPWTLDGETSYVQMVVEELKR